MKIRIAILSLLVLLTAGCEFIFSTMVTGVEISEDSITLNTGDTYQIQAQILPPDAENQTLYWNSSNTAVATVSPSGQVAALSSGSTVITATTAEGVFTDRMTVFVEDSNTAGPAITGIQLTLTNNTLLLGQSITPSVTTEPVNGDPLLINWRSSDPNVATVSPTGLITATGSGTVTITAEAGTASSHVILNVKDLNLLFSSSALILNHDMEDLYREVNIQDYILPLDPEGSVSDVTTENTPHMISHNNPATYGDTSEGHSDMDIIKAAITKLSVLNLNSNIGTTLSFTAAELPFAISSKILINEEAVYISVTSDGIYSSGTTNYEIIIYLGKNTRNMNLLYSATSFFFQSIPDAPAYKFQLLHEYNGTEDNMLVNSSELQSENPLTYDNSHIKYRVLTEGSNVVMMDYEEGRSQNMRTATPAGIIDYSLSYSSAEGSSHWDVTILNSQKEALATNMGLLPPDSDHFLTNRANELFTDIPLNYSLEKLLPLKPEYAADYTFKKISHGSVYGGNWFLRKNTEADGSPRAPLPAYNNQGGSAYADSVLDPALDHVINVHRLSSSNTGYYSETTKETQWFAGSAYSDVQGAIAAYNQLYTKYWNAFLNTTVDFSTIDRTQAESDILTSLK